MLFPTLSFAAFFAAVLPVSWLLMPHRVRWRLFMVAASWFFYGAADWRFVPLLAGSTVVNHFFARRIHHASGAARRTWTIVAITSDLAVLAWFKYIGFLSLSLQSGMRFLGIHAHVPLPEVLLPIGISFFTFQALSYVIDTARGKIQPVSLLEFAVYLSFFPHLVAGPIVRATEFLPQIKEKIGPRNVDVGKAFWLISLGLFKKVVIASYLGTYAADPLFGFPHQHAGVEALVGVYAYAIQIYADFSGYTDIAIGLALLLGIQFPQNFNAPYAAASLQDFWRRWHMTLSRWLRDYVYIPLGGNRKGRVRTYVNLMITMLLGGLWHGAAWTFVAWGGLHGAGLVYERWRGERPSEAGAIGSQGTGKWDAPVLVPARSVAAVPQGTQSAGAGSGGAESRATEAAATAREGAGSTATGSAVGPPSAAGSDAGVEATTSGASMSEGVGFEPAESAAATAADSEPATTAAGSLVASEAAATAAVSGAAAAEPATTAADSVVASEPAVTAAGSETGEAAAAAKIAWLQAGSGVEDSETAQSSSPEPGVTESEVVVPEAAVATRRARPPKVVTLARDAVEATGRVLSGPARSVDSVPSSGNNGASGEAVATATAPENGAVRRAHLAPLGTAETPHAEVPTGRPELGAGFRRSPSGDAVPDGDRSVGPAAEPDALGGRPTGPRLSPRARLWVGRLITFHVVCLAWIFFRASSFHNAVEVLRRIATLSGGHRHLNWKVLVVIVAALAVQVGPRGFGARLQVVFSRSRFWVQALVLGSMLTLIDLLGPAGVAPFIYFRF